MTPRLQNVEDQPSKWPEAQDAEIRPYEWSGEGERFAPQALCSQCGPAPPDKENGTVSARLDTEQMMEYMRQRAGAFMRILDGSVEAIDQERG